MYSQYNSHHNIFLIKNIYFDKDVFPILPTMHGVVVFPILPTKHGVVVFYPEGMQFNTFEFFFLTMPAKH